MYRRIMVPLDGSSFAERALPLAVRLSQRTGSRLGLVTVSEPSGPTALESRAYLERIAQRIESDHSGEVDTEVRVGQVVKGLIETERSSGADITVMATHGRGGVSRMWLGSVASGFLHQTDRPLVLVRPEDEGAGPVVHWGFAKLLVPLDGSDLSERVLAHAVEFGGMFDAAYHLTRIVAPPAAFTDGYAPPALTTEIMEAAAAAAGEYLERVAQPLRDAGLRVSTAVRTGPQAGRGILEEATESGCDSIAMATHGRVGLSRAFLGSAADKVLRGADVPVLLYRPDMVAKGTGDQRVSTGAPEHDRQGQRSA